MLSTYYVWGTALGTESHTSFGPHKYLRKEVLLFPFYR